MKLEQQIMNSIMDYLALKHVWFRRMNSGAVMSEYKGRKRMIRYGSVGMADILCSPMKWEGMIGEHPVFLWIEVKSPTGKQSKAQMDFMDEVRMEGHYYAVCSSIEAVEEILTEITH